MTYEQETAKEHLRALLNFPELILSDYSHDANAEARVGAVIIRHTAEGRSAQLVFQKFPNQAVNWDFVPHAIAIMSALGQKRRVEGVCRLLSAVSPIGDKRNFGCPD